MSRPVKAEVDKAQAEAGQSGPLASGNSQREVIDAQTELAQRQAELRQQELVAEVVKPAEADAERVRVLAKADAERDDDPGRGRRLPQPRGTGPDADRPASSDRREAAAGLANADITVLNGADGLGEIAAGLVRQGLTIFESVRRNLTYADDEAPPSPPGVGNGRGDSARTSLPAG